MTKKIILAVVGLLLIISLVQIFPVPPYGEDIYPLYRSGYFHELDRLNRVVVYSFLAIKMYRSAEYGWIYLQDLEKEGMVVTVYDAQGRLITAPGTRPGPRDDRIGRFISSRNTKAAILRDGRYQTLLRVEAEERCLICHRQSSRGATLGIMEIDQGADSMAYYSRERVLLFIGLSLLLLALFVLVKRWKPDSDINKLFDKE